jgi:cytochrome c-type biogenesis protein CcmH/NrfF
MPIAWWIPLTIVVLGAGAFVRARWRHTRNSSPTSEPVSSEWLADKRGREENRW